MDVTPPDAPALAAAARARRRGAVERMAVPAIAVYGVLLTGAALAGAWFHDQQGRPVPTDYLNVYAAGKLVQAGTPSLAYDWAVHRAAEVAAMGRDFGGYFGWHYPPLFLFAAAVLALMPYVPGLVAWAGATLVAYALTVRAILGDRVGALAALAFPATLWCFATGQNGFLTASLFGGALLALPTRPVLAGVLIGLLTYKPQFGLLVPIALVAGGHWRALAAATIATLALNAAALAAFGPGSFLAFWHSLADTNQAVFAEARANLDKMQSVYGLLHGFGAPPALAWAAQGIVTALAAVATAFAWRNPGLSYRLKAASLLALALIATPYAYVYDAPLLMAAIAFPLAQWIERGFDRAQVAALLLASVLVLAFPLLGKPTGFLATVLILALLWREARKTA